MPFALNYMSVVLAGWNPAFGTAISTDQTLGERVSSLLFLTPFLTGSKELCKERKGTQKGMCRNPKDIGKEPTTNKLSSLEAATRNPQGTLIKECGFLSKCREL
jgi:hypothetical protein